MCRLKRSRRRWVAVMETAWNKLLWSASWLRFMSHPLTRLKVGMSLTLMTWRVSLLWSTASSYHLSSSRTKSTAASACRRWRTSRLTQRRRRGRKLRHSCRHLTKEITRGSAASLSARLQVSSSSVFLQWSWQRCSSHEKKAIRYSQRISAAFLNLIWIIIFIQ